ncbi:mitochondrial cardiolipin hydrolase-like [Diabrotica undecimpunctata]|uniref:mitochondrial cardiolipin hydrolase-like n=1 Tax=Diabrotica undecimpunctata TaxID=50387 RepID=UPI003B63DBD0
MLVNLLENKYCVFGLTALAIIPWKVFYSKYKYFQKQYEEQLLFQNRHNCVVMYTVAKGMSGWPPHKDRILPDITSKDGLYPMYEPLIYFIKTAEKSIYVAYMFIEIQEIMDALVEAHERGVKVRILLNFEHNKSDVGSIQKLISKGIMVQLYMCPKQTLESIMHYKYMVKDYNQEKGGYTLISSLNISISAFTENYENIVLSSDYYLATSIHNNFENCWNYVELENQSLLNKTTLLDLNLI